MIYRSEADVQTGTVAAAARLNIRLLRNNSGVMFNPNGQPVRFGLGNTSKKLNRVFKSSDLIGFDHFGFFIAVECKEPGWKFTGTERETAQFNFLNCAASNGAFGAFISHPEQFTILYDLYISGKLQNIRNMFNELRYSVFN